MLSLVVFMEWAGVRWDIRSVIHLRACSLLIRTANIARTISPLIRLSCFAATFLSVDKCTTFASIMDVDPSSLSLLFFFQ